MSSAIAIAIYTRCWGPVRLARCNLHVNGTNNNHARFGRMHRYSGIHLEYPRKLAIKSPGSPERGDSSRGRAVRRILRIRLTAQHERKKKKKEEKGKPHEYFTVAQNAGQCRGGDGGRRGNFHRAYARELNVITITSRLRNATTASDGTDANACARQHVEPSTRAPSIRRSSKLSSRRSLGNVRVDGTWEFSRETGTARAQGSANENRKRGRGERKERKEGKRCCGCNRADYAGNRPQRAKRAVVRARCGA